MHTYSTKSIYSQLLAFSAVWLFVGPAQAAIFGPDTRQLVTPTSSYAELGRSTAIGVLNSLSAPTDATHIDLDLDPISDRLCRDERFSNQTSLSYACSAFLVGPDLLATAGHCVVNAGQETSHNPGDYCTVYNWLFDYQASENGTPFSGKNLAADHLYKCKEIVYAVNDQKAPFRDYALIRLDRPVLGRKPFSIAAMPATGDSVGMIGYPLGLPEVYSGAGRVILNNPARTSIVTNLNAFEGNSGSVVFNAKHEAVGLLISGSPMADTVDDPHQSCARSNHCDGDATKCDVMDAHPEQLMNFQHWGSDVERLDPLIALIKANSAP